MRIMARKVSFSSVLTGRSTSAIKIAISCPCILSKSCMKGRAGSRAPGILKFRYPPAPTSQQRIQHCSATDDLRKFMERLAHPVYTGKLSSSRGQHCCSRERFASLAEVAYLRTSVLTQVSRRIRGCLQARLFDCRPGKRHQRCLIYAW